MKVILGKTGKGANQGKAFEWVKLIGITGGGQAFVQAVGLICGITIIRLLPTKEYAFYTLANTMLGTMTVLADGGISSGVMAQGGKIWRDKEQLGVVMATGLDLRRKFAVVSLLVSIPILVYLLLNLGADWLITLSIILALIPAFFSALSDSILELPLKLHQNIKPLQKNQMLVALMRLVLSAVSLFFLPFTFIALLSNGIPRILGNIRLRSITFTLAKQGKKPDAEVRQLILKNVKRILPGAIYYCVSGQITVWLISIFGSSTSVAKLGALGRLSVILTLISTLFAQLVVPRFARMVRQRKLLISRFLQIQGLLFCIAIFVVGIVYLFPDQILWLLGNKYSDLNKELVLSIAASCINLMAGISFSLFVSRGWVINPLFSIPVSIFSIIIGILLFDMSVLDEAIYFNIFTACIQYIINSTYCFIKINRETDNV